MPLDAHSTVENKLHIPAVILSLQICSVRLELARESVKKLVSTLE